MNMIFKVSAYLCLFISLSFATTINVPADTASIQGGIYLASNGDTVLVADGLYYENINFKGKAIIVGSYFLLDGDTSHISNTIIDGSQPSNPDSGSVVYFISGEDTNSVLCGFTITGGSGTHPPGRMWYGGGVLCDNSDAKFMHVRVHSNGAGGQGSNGGGGFFIENSNTVLYNVKISNNGGGGIECLNSHLGLTEVEITQNITYDGGGIYSGDSHLILNNVIVDNNTAHGSFWAPGWGGGIFSGNSVAVLNNVQVRGNIVLNRGEIGGFGGGICCSNSDLYLTDVSIANNSSGFGGGISSASYDTLEFSNIYLSNVSITNNNSAVNTTRPGTVYGGFGGGIYSPLGVSVSFDPVNRSNIYNNSADSLGNDLYTNGDSLISVIVDTFTVLTPDSTHAYPLNKFTFDILNDTTGIAAKIDNEDLVPLLFSLKQNYPNPFNPTTTIEFSIPKSEIVTLRVYNLLGQRVATLVSDKLNPGEHKYSWNAGTLATGVYIYKIQVGNYQQTRKMIYLK